MKKNCTDFKNARGHESERGAGSGCRSWWDDVQLNRSAQSARE